MADKRIIEQTATSEVFVDDWLVKDSSTEGTTKIRPSNLKDYIAAGLVPETMVADEYVTTSTYDSGDICIYEGVLYKALEDDITGDWDSTKWDAITISSELENSGTGDVADVYENGESVVDPTDKIARIHGHKEVTQAQYDALPSSKLTDGIMYCIKDSEFSAENVPYDNTTSHAQATNTQSAIDEAFSRTVDLAGAISSISASPYSTQHSYHVGDYAMYDYKLYRCIADTSGAWDSTKWEEVKVTDELQELDENKADTDGFYDELFAGNLVTDMHTADNKPYLYRQSPSASSVSQNIVGGTVVWNQFYKINSFNHTLRGLSSSITNSVITITGTTESAGYCCQLGRIDFANDIKGHKVARFIDFSLPNGVRVADQYNNNAQPQSNTIVEIASSLTIPQIFTDSGNVNVSVSNGHISFIDLTQAFGSTIADYVYTLESGTAGSGIAWLKANGFLTKAYYPYDSGSLQSVKTSGRKIVGKNLWGGAKLADDIVAKVPNATKNTTNKTVTYAASSMSGIVLFDKFKSNTRYSFYFSTESSFTNVKVVYTDNTQESPVPNTVYVSTANKTIKNLSGVYSSGNTTLKYEECGVFEGVITAQDFEPYKTTTYPLDSDLTLRGIVKKDANNNLYYDGDVYSADGVVRRKRKQVILDGSRGYGSIQTGTNTVRAYLQISEMMPNNTTESNIISVYPTYTPDYMYSSNDIEGISENKNANVNGIWFRIAKSKLSSYDLTGIQAYLTNNPIVIEYELKTPTSDSAIPYQNPQLVGSTEEFVDTRDVPIPVGGERKYYTDLKAKLEELAKIPSVPTTNGTYTLKATRSASGVVYNWVSD